MRTICVQKSLAIVRISSKFARKNFKNRVVMKRIVFILSIVMSALISFVVEAKSTMELLINKDWQELDVKTMRAHEGFYVRFTGTQRMIVGADSEGNTKARVQKYYLSNRYEDTFDSTKVGKKRNGRFLIIQGNKDGSNAICLEIKTLKEDQLSTIDKNHPNNLRKNYFYTDPKSDKYSDNGKVISTIELLEKKIWFQIDPITGQRLNIEHQYLPYGKFFRCVMPENRRTQFPQWFRREFYLSDTIVTKFNRKLVGKRINGRYLVVNELDSDGSWQAATYDIATLSENRLELECVYPKGYATQVFVSSLYSQNAEHARRKPQQSELMKDDWYRLDTTTFKRSHYVERYNKTHVTRIVPIYSGGDTIELKKIYEYYMSNQPETEFDWSKKGKTSEGDYIVVNEQDLTGKWKAVNYRVELLSGGNMVTVKEVPGDTIMQAFERDLSEEEQLKLAYQQKQQAEVDTTKEKTMMDMLVGKQWRQIAENDLISDKIRFLYFTEYQFAIPSFHRTDGGYISDIDTYEYRLTNKPGGPFSRKDQIKKKQNGNFINHLFYCMVHGWVPGNYRIQYLSDKLMILYMNIEFLNEPPIILNFISE